MGGAADDMACVSRLDYHHPEAKAIQDSLKKTGDGFIHFGSDGVYRSYTSDGEVVDYKQLSPTEISLLLASFEPLISAEAFAKLQAKMEGVDGRNVTDQDQLLHPGAGVRPRKFEEDS